MMKKITQKKLVCELCGVTMLDQVLDKKLTNKVIDNYLIKRMNLLALKFCIVDGQPHQYQYVSASGKNICAKCGNSDTHQYTKEELMKVGEMLNAQKAELRETIAANNKMYDQIDMKQQSYIQSVVSKNMKGFEQSITAGNTLQFIDTFITELREILGEEIKGEYPIHLS